MLILSLHLKFLPSCYQLVKTRSDFLGKSKSNEFILFEKLDPAIAQKTRHISTLENTLEVS